MESKIDCWDRHCGGWPDLKCLLARCKHNTGQCVIGVYIHIIGKIHPGLYDNLSEAWGNTVISRANNAAKNDMGS